MLVGGGWLCPVGEIDIWRYVPSVMRALLIFNDREAELRASEEEQRVEVSGTARS